LEEPSLVVDIEPERRVEYQRKLRKEVKSLPSWISQCGMTAHIVKEKVAKNVGARIVREMDALNVECTKVFVWKRHRRL
jgi:hypothetical protein